ncbi:uncharacterized protein FIBRA_05421 [Fibroporia radiculosa]|uniref:Uncharacterized protein n=1 Tax=Fibroporia radiculosa TaxID=599839 RepID=J4G9C8_9APHY|nr:uncharacterized protein FIBRA_05421 [Fibroporia radiculosa]CCM03293.1 predicted protein [Fibroporia radiculosa]
MPRASRQAPPVNIARRDERLEEALEVPANWRTISITNAAQALSLFSVLEFSEDVPSPATYTRNLWVRTEYVQGGNILEDLGVGIAYKLLQPCTVAVEDIVAHGNVQNFAVDPVLLNEGWFVESRIRPGQVLLLENECPSETFNFAYETSMFNRTTHVILEHRWEQLVPILPPEDPLQMFPAVKYLCIRVSAMLNHLKALQLIDQLLGCKKLERLIVCVDSGEDRHCVKQNLVWQFLNHRAHFSEHRLAVHSIARSMKHEWEAIVTEGRTIWDRVGDKEETQPMDERGGLQGYL